MAGGINSGTAGGMLEFLEYLINKGYAPPSAVTPWMSASRSVLQAVEGETWESTDIRALDLDEAFRRFETIRKGSYKAESLAAYKKRFTRAVVSYREWLENDVRPTFGTRAPRRIDRSGGGAGEGARNGAEPLTQDAQTGAVEQGMVTYPFPLANGVIAKFTLPQKLPKAEATRIAAFVQAIAIDPVLELPPGQEGSP